MEIGSKAFIVKAEPVFTKAMLAFVARVATACDMYIEILHGSTCSVDDSGSDLLSLVIESFQVARKPRLSKDINSFNTTPPTSSCTIVSSSTVTQSS